MDKMQTLINNIKNDLIEHIKNVDVDSVMTLVVKAMETADTYANVSGQNKKEAVLNALSQILEEKETLIKLSNNHIPEEVFDTLKFVIDSGLVSRMIDTIVDVSKHKFNIHETIGTKTACCLSMFQTVINLFKK